LPRDDAPFGELRGALSQSAGRRLERPGRSRSPISTESFRPRRERPEFLSRLALLNLVGTARCAVPAPNGRGTQCEPCPTNDASNMKSSSARCFAGGDIAARCPYQSQVHGTPPEPCARIAPVNPSLTPTRSRDCRAGVRASVSFTSVPRHAEVNTTPVLPTQKLNCSRPRPESYI